MGLRQVAAAVLGSTALTSLFASSTPVLAACSTTGTAPVVFNCAANTTTTNTTNTTTPNAATNDREQQFNDSINGTVQTGVTVDGFGLALTSTQAGGTVTMTNNGTIQ